MKKAVATEKAPKALGPYSQAIRSGNHLFLSGQIPIDPASGNITAATIEEQTTQVIKNLTAVLAAEDLQLGNVVKTTCFLKNMEDFPKFNEVYSKFFQAPFPARSTVEVARLPKDVKVEIEAIAVIQ